MAYDGGPHDWELDELESMKTVCAALCHSCLLVAHVHSPIP